MITSVYVYVRCRKSSLLTGRSHMSQSECTCTLVMLSSFYHKVRGGATGPRSFEQPGPGAGRGNHGWSATEHRLNIYGNRGNRQVNSSGNSSWVATAMTDRSSHCGAVLLGVEEENFSPNQAFCL